MDRVVDGDFTFVTNNAVDFRRLYARRDLHAGLIIIVPQVAPRLQGLLFATLLNQLSPGDLLINEVIEITLDGATAVFRRYELPEEPGP